jgi:predicted  nucleic acid-binding Zn-ribbon protein
MNNIEPLLEEMKYLEQSKAALEQETRLMRRKLDDLKKSRGMATHESNAKATYQQTPSGSGDASNPARAVQDASTQTDTATALRRYLPYDSQHWATSQ